MDKLKVVEYLYQNHYRYLFKVAYNLCEKWDMAEDLVHDGFVKAMVTEIEFDDWIHARKYLTGCVRNAAFERFHREARIKAMKKDALTNEDELPNSFQTYIAATISKLKSTMSQIVIREIYWHNYSRREVAKIYGVNRDFIRKQEKTALLELKKLLFNFRLLNKFE